MLDQRTTICSNESMKYRAHRNLNSTIGDGRAWSYYGPGSKRVQHTGSMVLDNVTVKQPSGKAFQVTLAGGHRAVFTWFKSDSIRVNTTEQPPVNAVRVRFNPRNGDRFFHIDGKRVDYMRRVWLTADGESYATI